MRAFFSLLFFGTLSGSLSQTRISLLEEFTGETCVPCAAYNPAFDALMAKPVNASKMIVIKWQVPIPTPPGNSASLYQTNKAEIDWRYTGSSLGGYGYQHQNSPSSMIVDGVPNAPTCRVDGQNVWTFGAASNHPYHMKDSVIGAAAAVPTPFSITLTPVWDATFSNCTVSVSVSSSAAFTSVGNLKFRLCLVERFMEFQSAPGSNGEKRFHDVVRKSYPVSTSGSAVTDMGTALPTSWTSGQLHAFTIACAIPSYINDKSQMAFVGFIQDDGDKKIYQAERTSKPSVPNNAAAGEVQLPLLSCSASETPSVTITNEGPTPITAFTISPALDGNVLADVTWSGNLGPGASTFLALNNMALSAGTHTLMYTITQVSGGDIILSNNTASRIFMNASAYSGSLLSEGFEGAAFPPSNWMIADNGGGNRFEHYNFGAFGNSSNSIGYKLYSAWQGEVDELWLPPADLAGPLGAKLTFDFAYTGQPGSEDSLFVLLSEDCGQSWKTVYKNGGNAMHTAPYTGNAQFDPQSQQWAGDSVDLDAHLLSNEILIRFRIVCDRGSNLYLDNIRLWPGTGTGTVNGLYQHEKAKIQVYPNPASTNLFIELEDTFDSPSFKLRIVDLCGRVVLAKKPAIDADKHNLEIDCSGLSEGVYVLQLYNGQSVSHQKLLISR